MMSENEPVNSVNPTPQFLQPQRRRLSWAVSIIIVVMIVAVLGFLFIPLILNTNKSNPHTEKVLTLADLDKSGIELDGKTSDASLNNLTKELKDKIEKQIADKENPIDTVTTLIGVLCSTANTTRTTQCIDYVTALLDTKMDTLKLSSAKYGQPDELQITYWRAQFYANLAYNYGFIMDNKFTGADGKPLNTTAEQLKYINLYLEIAQNTANWGEPQISEADGHTWYSHEYQDTDYFIEWREQLKTRGAQ